MPPSLSARLVARIDSWLRAMGLGWGSLALAASFPLAATIYIFSQVTPTDGKLRISIGGDPTRARSKSDFSRKYVVYEAGSSQKGSLTEQVSHRSWNMMELEQPLVIAMVGLPARGKSYIVKMLIRYLSWISFEAEVFNVGSYRRKIGLSGADSSFFSPSNKDASRLREDMAKHVQDEMYLWLKNTQRRVAIFDATNTTKERRLALCQRARREKVQLLFVESICDNQEVLNSNYELKLQNEDYRGMDPVQAKADFLSRVASYEKVYETIEDDEDGGNISYLKLINVGQKTITRGCSGYLPSQVAFYLQNVHIHPRKIFFSLAADTVVAEGGPQMTDNGRQYSLDFANYFVTRRIANPSHVGDEYLVQCGTDPALAASVTHLQRTFPCFSTALLNDIRQGDFEGLSREKIKEKYPDEYLKLMNNRLGYRAPGGGESYLDVIERTRPIVIELERQRKNVVVVAGLAVLKCLFAYFMGTKTSGIPLLKFKAHHIYELTPGPFGCTIREINPAVEC